MNVEANIELLDEFLGFIKEGAPTKGQLRETQKAELDLWHHWNNNGRKPKNLKPLMDSFKPLLEKQSRVWKNKVEIPTSAIDAEFKRHAVDACKTYDPNRGVLLSTWVQGRLRKSS